MFDFIAIHNRIKELREYYNIPVQDLASYLDLSVDEVEALEANEKKLTLRVLDKLCALYRCSEMYIMCETDEYEPIQFKYGTEHLTDLDCIAAINKIVMNMEFLDGLKYKEVQE